MYENLNNWLNQGNYKKYLIRLLKNMAIEHETGCWLFRGHTTNGYGIIMLCHERETKQVRAHRFIAYCFYGLDLFNLDLDACHNCDRTDCINPLHLWIGTRSENFHDSSNKGRWHSGSHTGRNKNYINNLRK